MCFAKTAYPSAPPPKIDNIKGKQDGGKTQARSFKRQGKTKTPETKNIGTEDLEILRW